MFKLFVKFGLSAKFWQHCIVLGLLSYQANAQSNSTEKRDIGGVDLPASTTSTVVEPLYGERERLAARSAGDSRLSVGEVGQIQVTATGNRALDEVFILSGDGPAGVRGESGEYFCSLTKENDEDYPYDYVVVYRCAVDPSVGPWTFLATIWSNAQNLYCQDIEPITSADRMLVALSGDFYTLWAGFFQISNVPNFGFVAVDSYSDDGVWCPSLASDEIEYNGASVYGYLTYRIYSNLYFSRTTDLGVSWAEPTYLSESAEYSVNHDAIAYDDGSNRVFITYSNFLDDIRVARSSARGDGPWNDVAVLSHASQIYSTSSIAADNSYVVVGATSTTPGGESNIAVTYSTNGGANWSAVQTFSDAGFEYEPRVAANADGYFSLFYRDATAYKLLARRASTANLNSSGWTLRTVDSLHYAWGGLSAAIAPGESPAYGGAWSTGVFEGPGNGDCYFNWACVTPAQVTGVNASDNSCTGVTISWSNIAGEDSFQVRRNGTRIGRTLANILTYTDNTATIWTTYSYTVVPYNSCGSGTPSIADNGMRLGTPAQIPNVLASSNLCNQVNVTWGDVAGETGFRVYRNGGQIATLGADVLSYLDAPPSCGVDYSYTVQAYNACGNATMSAAGVGVRPCPLPAVGSVAATDDGCVSIVVTWTASYAGEDSFQIRRDGARIGRANANVATYTDMTALPGIPYTYRVVAYNGCGASDTSGMDVGMRRSAPAQVTGVAASDTSCTSVVVGWSDVAEEDSFQVRRNGTRIGRTLTGQLTYTDNTATPGTIYAYTVVAYNACGASVVSAADNGIRLGSPAQVTGVIASDNDCDGVTVTWNNVSGESGYRIFRSAVEIGTVGTDVLSFTDDEIACGSSANYTVQAFSPCGTGNVSSANSGLRPCPLGPVGNVSATDALCTQVTVTWSSSVAGEDSFQIWRDGVRIGRANANATSFTDAAAPGGETHTYCVVAFNLCGAGSAEGCDNGTRQIRPAIVTNVTASDDNCNAVIINWAEVATADSYVVKRGSTRLGRVLPPLTTFTDLTGNVWTEYTYRVIAYNECGIGDTNGTDIGVRVTAPDQVVGVSASANRCDVVALSWIDQVHETGYEVLRDGVLIASVGADVVAYDDATTPGSYNYSVHALNSCGAGAASLPATGVLLTNLPVVGFVAASDVSCDHVELTWDPEFAGEDNFFVYRDGVELISLPGNQSSFIDVTAEPGQSYQYCIVAVNPCGEGDPSGCDVGLRLNVPEQVTNVSASDIACTEVIVNWSDVPGEDGFQIRRDNVPIGNVLENQLSYLDATAVPGVPYAYAIVAYNACGSGPASASDQGLRQSIPSQVIGVEAGETNCSHIAVTWNDVSDEDGYRLLRNGLVIDSTGPDVTSYQDASATCGVDFDYAVIAYNECGALGASSSDAGFRPCQIAQVTQVNATDTECDFVLLSWDVNVLHEDGFSILRDNVEVGQAAANSSSYMDNTAVGGVTYSYQVRAFNACGLSDPSAADFGMRRPVPAQVSGVVASDNRCDSVVVNWVSVNHAELYRIIRDGAEIATVDAVTTRFAHVPPAGVATYQIIAQNSCGTSALSVPENGSRLESPQSPTQVTASDEGCGVVNVEWTGFAGDVDSFVVLRNGVQIGRVGASVLSYSDAVASGSFLYAVRSLSIECGEAPSLDDDQGTSHDLPTTPGDIVMDPVNCAAVNFHWSPSAGEVAGYIVRRDGDSLRLVTTTSFSDSTVMDNAAHSYTVTAFSTNCGETPATEPANGRMRELTLLGVLPDTVDGCTWLRFTLDHCVGVTRDSIFLALDGVNFTFVAVRTPVGQIDSVYIDNAGVFRPNARLRITSMRDQRRDVLESEPFAVLPCSDANELIEELPQDLALEQNYPNPFNASTGIRFALPHTGNVLIEIFDITGRKVGVLMDGQLAQGWHTVSWSCAECPTGMYVVRLQAEGTYLLRKMLLLK